MYSRPSVRPAAAAEKLRIAPQGLGETVGLTADSMAGFDQQLDLLFERENLASLRFVSRLDLLLKILNALAQRIEK
jgi:hypothetical protein